MLLMFLEQSWLTNTNAGVALLGFSDRRVNKEDIFFFTILV